MSAESLDILSPPLGINPLISRICTSSEIEGRLSLGREEIKNINDGYSRVIKSRFNKKLQNFINDEMPLLIEKDMSQNFVTLQKIVIF